MNHKVTTRDHNIEVLNNLGFTKFKNTTVFENQNNFILSPAVSESTNGSYWFDIREVNLNHINNKSLLLVRIVPDLFILKSIKSISELLTKEVMDNRPNSGNVWGIHISMNKPENKAELFNIKNQNIKISTKLLNKEEVVDNYHVIKKNI